MLKLEVCKAWGVYLKFDIDGTYACNILFYTGSVSDITNNYNYFNLLL